MASVSGSSILVSNVISGKIVHKESGDGIADLLVELFDLDDWADPEVEAPAVIGRELVTVPPDRIAPILPGDISALYKRADRVGSVITNATGQFVFEVTPKDFNLPRKAEQKPDLVLLVLAPDEPGLDLTQRLLHLAKDIYFNAGSREAYIVRLSTALLVEKQIPFGLQREQGRETVKNRLSLYVDERTREREFGTAVADYHGVQAAQETQERKIFRKNLIKKIATDLSIVPLRGVVAADGDSIQAKNSETINTGIAKANTALSNAQGVPVNLYLTSADKTRLHSYFENATEDFTDIPDGDIKELLFRTNSTENPATLLIHNNPIASFCAAESADEQCAKTHAGLTDPQTPVPPEAPAPVDAGLVDQDIPTYIGRLVKHMPPPDMVLQPALTKKRAGKAEVEKAVNEFSLQKGPAEVPAFYDFSSLQIAFDHVWKQLFDESIPDLAYTANALGKARFGLDAVADSAFRNGLTLTDTFYTITPEGIPPVVAKLFDITKEEFNEMSIAIREQLISIANSISAQPGSTVGQLRIIHALTEQGERLIDSVRHDNYYSLHRTLRELHDRMTGKYEFTVFAADKDYHSVNFGLLNTYRQQWMPLTYQAGRLIKTLALSPSEKRTYSIRINRNEKRSSKEAKKNNSSITNERSSTARAEAEIMAKAQNKSTFSLSAEGDYDIGISEGKSTTTFGVEAMSESSQNRKDFREAVLKAVQDYKEEFSTELATEVDSSSEASESVTITNPNDELAVTYLFYDLQKRYRLSEQIYRITPVVLVAQEVPSPDQITPAWVISNDWILNRQLLDDSFRPTLQYLANNSVGDDFSLRELRKNLRQQRNLVETLKVEFAAASREAENKYLALLKKIDTRISEEAEDGGEGFFTNVGAFFGYDDANPEVAKARELAASDEHKYAVDKAEKMAAALQQEVNTLHALTDQYNKTLQTRLDNETKVKRLLVHIRNNIFYYMQAIWSMEPPDQRYLRLYKVQVPMLELESRSYRVKVEEDADIFASFREPGTQKHRAFLHGTLKHNPNGTFDTKSLVEVADLDTLLGFKGNYMIFPMKEHNALTEFMAAPYVDSAFGAMDPDELSNVSLDEYSKYVCCLHHKLPTTEFEAIKAQLRAWLEKLLATPLRNGDEIVVPTGSLFIEALVDQNAILEDFKLKHRELDVFKVQEEVRRAGLENLRLAARLLNSEREDPDIEKKIVVERGIDTTVES